MIPSPRLDQSGYNPGSPRQRAMSAVLSAAIILAAFLLALYQTGVLPQVGGGKALTTFDVPAEKQAAAKTSRQHAAIQPAAHPMPRPKINIARPDAPQVPVTPGFIHMSHDDFIAGDIGRIRGQQLAQGNADAGGSDAGAGGAGGGGGGNRLYNADWYRRPTDAQLSTYLPKANPGPGWGEVACQTIDHFRVDNCRILGESPSGSGYGRAVLDAAWQFEVIPPRINSTKQVGAWVRIRIDYTERGARAS